MKTCIICGSNDFKLNSERFCSQKCIHTYGARKAGLIKFNCPICNKEIRKSLLSRHLKTHTQKEIHYFCENCGTECFEKYGSGRFCSVKCSRGFSTKAKRKEINEKVSNTIIQKLKNGEPIGYITTAYQLKEKEIRQCPICKKEYETYKISKRKTCSRKCGYKLMKINNTGLKHKPIKDTSKMGGLRPGGGKAKQISYTNWLGYKMSLNKEEIKVAEILDKKKLNWNRNTRGFPYKTVDGKDRRYYPDFVINNDNYIEYKGWITEEMHHKMKDSINKNNLNLIIVIGMDKRYKEFGLNLEQFEKYLSNNFLV